MMEIVKNIILLITTIYCISAYWKSPGHGTIVYLLIFAVSSLIGFSRGILEESIIIPICLALFCGKNKGYSPLWIVYIVFISVITLINGNKIFGEYDEIMLAGFMFLAVRYSLFSDERIVYKTLFALWLFAQCKTLNLVLLTGASAFTIADANDISSRMLETTTIYGSEGVIDPNYFSLVAGMGAIITFFIIKNSYKFNYYIGNNWLDHKYILYVILLFDMFFTFRGLSRGILIAFLGAILVYLIFSRVKLSNIVLITVLSIVVLVFADKIPIISGFVNRFESDNSGGGRFIIWAAIAKVLIQDGLFAVIFGEGMNFHWWNYDNTVAMGELLSSHNSIVTILISTGLIGGIILFSLFIKAYINAFHRTDTETIYKIVLLTFILLGCMSIEPLHFIWAWIVLALGCSISSNKNTYEKKTE